MIRGNHVHDNVGIGLWLDLNNRYAIIENNLIEDNYGSGIFDELSNGTTIRGNVLRGNRHGPEVDGIYGGAEIQAANSQRGNVYENDIVVSGPSRAVVLVYESYRGEFPGQDYYVHHNTIRFTEAPRFRDDYHPFSGILGGAGNDPFWTSNNRFDYNTYYIPDTGGRHWFWGEGLDWAGFRERGHEANGQCFAGEEGADC